MFRDKSNLDRKLIPLYNMNNEKEIKRQEEVQVSNFNWIVPECCREGWASCPHVVKREKPKKKNIGL